MMAALIHATLLQGSQALQHIIVLSHPKKRPTCLSKPNLSNPKRSNPSLQSHAIATQGWIAVVTATRVFQTCVYTGIRLCHIVVTTQCTPRATSFPSHAGTCRLKPSALKPLRLKPSFDHPVALKPSLGKQQKGSVNELLWVTRPRIIG